MKIKYLQLLSIVCLFVFTTSCNRQSINNETMITEKATALAEEMVAEKLAMMEKEAMVEKRAMMEKEEMMKKEAMLKKPSIYLGSREYTLAVAEAMPADMYTFTPNPNAKTFGEQMTHVAMATKFLINLFTSDGPPPTQEQFTEAAAFEKQIAGDKTAVINLLNENFDYIEDLYANMTAEDFDKTFKVPFDPNSSDHEMTKAFDYVAAHIAHHRAQAATYLRINDINPPGFTLY